MDTEWIILNEFPLSRTTSKSLLLSLSLPPGTVTYIRAKGSIWSPCNRLEAAWKLLWAWLIFETVQCQKRFCAEPRKKNLTKTFALVIDLVFESITYISSKSRTNSGSRSLRFLKCFVKKTCKSKMQPLNQNPYIHHISCPHQITKAHSWA